MRGTHASLCPMRQTLFCPRAAVCAIGWRPAAGAHTVSGERITADVDALGATSEVPTNADSEEERRPAMIFVGMCAEWMPVWGCLHSMPGCLWNTQAVGGKWWESYSIQAPWATNDPVMREFRSPFHLGHGAVRAPLLLHAQQEVDDANTRTCSLLLLETERTVSKAVHTRSTHQHGRL